VGSSAGPRWQSPCASLSLLTTPLHFSICLGRHTPVKGGKEMYRALLSLDPATPSVPGPAHLPTPLHLRQLTQAWHLARAWWWPWCQSKPNGCIPARSQASACRDPGASPRASSGLFSSAECSRQLC